MVMTMTTTMNRTAAQSVRPTAPTLPTRDEYRDGMKKLRDKLSCPVLIVDEQALADDLLEYDWSVERNSSIATTPKRPSVDDYLKQQYQKNMLARYPEFERRTDTDIAALKHALDQMYVFSAIVVMLLALVLLFGVWQLLSLVI